MISVRLLETGIASNKRQYCHRLQLLTRASSGYASPFQEAKEYWPKQIPRMIGWQLNPITRFCLRVNSAIKPEVQLFFAEKRKDEDLICQFLRPSCLKALFKYYAEPSPTINVKTKEALASAHILEPDRVIFYEDSSFKEEAWSISSSMIRRKLLPRKPNIMFELAFYTSLTRAVNMKHIADLMHEHESRSLDFGDEEEAKDTWIQWSELCGPYSGAHSLADTHNIPYRDIHRYLEIVNYNSGNMMREYDVNRLLVLYSAKKHEIPVTAQMRPRREEDVKEDKIKEETK